MDKAAQKKDFYQNVFKFRKRKPNDILVKEKKVEGNPYKPQFNIPVTKAQLDYHFNVKGYKVYSTGMPNRRQRKMMVSKQGLPKRNNKKITKAHKHFLKTLYG